MQLFGSIASILMMTIALSWGIDDGKYRPPAVATIPIPITTTTTIRPPYYRNPYDYTANRVNDGRYIGVNDGRYNAGVDATGGRYYTNTEGRFYITNDGRHVRVGDATGAITTPIAAAAIRPSIYRNDYRGTDPYRRFSAGNSLGVTPWSILRNENIVGRDGYHYVFETGNGIVAEETGAVAKVGLNEEALRAQGSYQYTGDDGVIYRVEYTADENGFQAKGDHIPKTPPAILRLLDYLAKQPKKVQKFETGNGIVAEETGAVAKVGLNEEALRAQGSYQYTGDDGVIYRVEYTADENGFQAKGDHIPKTPPAILRLLDYLAKQPKKVQK